MLQLFPCYKMVLTLVVSALSSSTGSTGMSVAKTTVDKLLKGYDIRLRPDFGGRCRGDTPTALGVFGLCCPGYSHVKVCTQWYFRVVPLEAVGRGGLWQNTCNSFEVTATMLLLCIYSHIEDGCSLRSRAHTETSSRTAWFWKPGVVSVLIFNTIMIRDVSWPLCVT